jgi:hypothetical protein
MEVEVLAQFFLAFLSLIHSIFTHIQFVIELFLAHVTASIYANSSLLSNLLNKFTLKDLTTIAIEMHAFSSISFIECILP